ncbi:chromate transporter [Ignisphaera sp. 4213-co]|uniref:Chromate transporter n=1 Tax=Ignisphaera cupida TaxID=3050454 RepID=A0ABD4Z6W4_9CREN|nr:chromate transporter [Ignisphaera sp. 4213-co]MDK6028979.1 chromate transporter [Ignisphaera sp. 4213-co]
MADLATLFSLFITFLKIGAVMFGGGQAMIPILRYEVVVRNNWLSEEEFLDLVAIAESTPGPVAVNAATYIGYKIGGVLGSAIATIAVVTPAFAVILSIAIALQKFYENYIVRSILNGIRGAVIGLFTAALITVVKGVYKGLQPVSATMTTLIAITVLISIVMFDVDPILLIIASAIAGLILGLLGVWRI